MLGTKELQGPAAESEDLSGVVRIIEIMGTSATSFDEAIKSAVRRATETLRHITGVDVEHMTARVKDREIVEYRVDLKVAFGIEKED